MNARNYYGWHVMERYHRLMSGTWRPFVIKFMSFDSDRSVAGKTQKSKRS